MGREMTGAEIVVKALIDQNVEHIFGYPGGAVLPIYDELYEDRGNNLYHALVRHEQGAVHAAEGYARSTGKVGVALVTSGPGATNAVTGLTDALLDSVPLVVITGQVPTSVIGTDAFQEADVVGITRPCTKHNYLVRDVNELAHIMHEAFYIARSGRPGPVLIDIPKDVQIARGKYRKPHGIEHRAYHPVTRAPADDIQAMAEMIMAARKPVFYTGGGIINSGQKASNMLRQLVELTNFPVTSTLMGLGAFPASDKRWLGMLGMHGTYEANLAMYGCDLMINIGARFDDRITGLVSAFSPGSKKIHVDIDPSSFNKTVMVDLAVQGDAGQVMEDLLEALKTGDFLSRKQDISDWWQQINIWRGEKCLEYERSTDTIMPQYAIERLYQLTKDRDTYITTEVGQHQMWAAQYFHFEAPNRWMTSGGLGTMGYGFPAAIGVQMAHPKSLVIDIAGEASIQMVIQEMSTAVQHNLPVKVFILNNEYMGMVRQWQELQYDDRLSESYSAALPDFVKLAEAYGWHGIRCDNPADLDAAILEMIDSDKPVLFDCRVKKLANCFPMILSGKPHNEMLLNSTVTTERMGSTAGEEGKELV